MKEDAGAEKMHTGVVRIIGVLLLLQAAGLISISVFNVSRLGVAPMTLTFNLSLSPDEVYLVLTTTPLVVLGILAIVAGISFLLLRRIGWLLAMSVQGLTLYFCLHLYFLGRKPDFVYPIMLYSILMVLYLNSFDVQMAFRAPSEGNNRR
ncbi:MAG: hypothetical protein EPO21_12805 [Chloroflexota bacterium]|nr:MAG: hypothetical protein EPO21_12805 [Chloroflexota bacterium]